MGVSDPFDGTVHPVSSRSARCRRRTSERITVGILLSDRYVVYKKLARQWEGLELAFAGPTCAGDFSAGPRLGLNRRAGR